MSSDKAGGNSEDRSGGTNSNTNNNKDGTPTASRRGMSGLAGSNFNRRSSLGMAEAALGDLFGRRASGFSDLDVLGRRGSLDSTSAVLDAAIMDLTRRRLSMAMGIPGDDPFGGGYGAAAAMGMDAMGGYGFGSLGMNMSAYAPAPPLSSSSPNNGNSKNNNNADSSEMDSQQREIQKQQRELERRQKELEIQRQQLMSAMEERRMVMQQMQQNLGQMATPPSAAMPRNSLLGSFGGGLGGGYGGANSSLLMAGFGGGRAFPSGGGGAPMGVPAAGANPEWSVCRICNSRAFASRDEATQHEAICMAMSHRASLGLGGGGRRNSLDLLVGTLDRPEFAARFASQSLKQDGRRDSLGFGGISDRRFSLLGMGGMDHMASMPTQSPMNADQPSSIPNTMSTGPFALMDHPLSLAMESDKEWLTPLHCFVRQYCVHVFTASEQDVQTPSKGKRKPIQVGQVGIRCPHCHHDIESSIKARERGSVYYPTSISSIYNATMNLLQRHLHNCTSVPTDIMRRYESLKADDARSGTSKKYWIESAMSLGLVDTESGIRFTANTPPPLLSTSRHQGSTTNDVFSNNFIGGLATMPNASSGDGFASLNRKKREKAKGRQGGSNTATGPETKSKENPEMAGPLVRSDDEPWATEFSFHLLCQMQPCVFTEADRLGKRKGLPPGFPGLACRHCFGGYGSGRFFPSSIKTLSDTSKTLNVLHNHMMRCRKCPPEIREALARTRKLHDEQRAKMKFGSQKAFFGRIWDRLHLNDPNVTSKRKFKPSEVSQQAQMPAPPQVNSFDAGMAMQDQYGENGMITKRQKI